MNILEEDIDNLVRRTELFECFHNSSVLITGATGLLGSIMTKSLLKKGNVKVYACCRSEKKFVKIFSDYLCNNLIPVYSDIQELRIDSFKIDYVIHGASITDSKTFVENPVETIVTAVEGTRNLLSQCIRQKLKGFVYLSSLEVYGTFNDCDGIKNVLESDSGYLDCTAIRSSYSESKRMAETLCKAYQSEYNIPVKIVRLCQTFGAGVDYFDNRVFAQFARACIEGKDIVLKTKGETVRNYCYTTDAVAGIFTVLNKGYVGDVYNIANMSTTISIADMADLVANLNEDGVTKVIFDISESSEKLGYNPVVKLQLDSAKLSHLGWTPEYRLTEMYKRLINSLKEGAKNKI